MAFLKDLALKVQSMIHLNNLSWFDFKSTWIEPDV